MPGQLHYMLGNWVFSDGIEHPGQIHPFFIKCWKCAKCCYRLHIQNFMSSLWKLFDWGLIPILNVSGSLIVKDPHVHAHLYSPLPLSLQDLSIHLCTLSSISLLLNGSPLGDSVPRDWLERKTNYPAPVVSKHKRTDLRIFLFLKK